MTNKVPQITLAFWVIKIAGTTLGETGGDALSMTLDLGYAISTAIFFGVFVVTAGAQIAASRFYRFLYWTVIIATTTVGTTTSDFLTRKAGLGYAWTSLILFAAVLAVLAVWHYTLGSVDVNRIANRKAEAFYWLTILTSNTLGTAVGDCVADTSGFGYGGGAIIFGAALAIVATLYFSKKLPNALLFWAAFILTRPLGATLGDILTKPMDHGGLNLGRFASTAAIAGFMIICIFLTSSRSKSDGDDDDDATEMETA